ncbi:hypothetical protein [Sphingomonas sp. BK345]|uniref:hypothetical protein n=1 Tax=Sphingomonas sp. BK345 TaxID=2586980 RepID=UPI00160B285E|nr:hypothetical protein [Sphingomonas sp. BK345]MBB3472183.1 hypothetical protein [Sphingomonas sp. BK345]
MAPPLTTTRWSAAAVLALAGGAFLTARAWRIARPAIDERTRRRLAPHARAVAHPGAAEIEVA